MLHVVLHVVLHVCCMCVACALHEQSSRATGEVTSVAGTRILGGRREILEAENLKSAITSESILCVQYVLMHLEMQSVSQCPRGQKGQEAEKQTKVNALCFSESGKIFFSFQSFSLSFLSFLSARTWTAIEPFQVH